MITEVDNFHLLFKIKPINNMPRETMGNPFEDSENPKKPIESAESPEEKEFRLEEETIFPIDEKQGEHPEVLDIEKEEAPTQEKAAPAENPEKTLKDAKERRDSRILKLRAAADKLTRRFPFYFEINTTKPEESLINIIKIKYKPIGAGSEVPQDLHNLASEIERKDDMIRTEFENLKIKMAAEDKRMTIEGLKKEVADI
jgi:hypothetical protein